MWLRAIEIRGEYNLAVVWLQDAQKYAKDKHIVRVFGTIQGLGIAFLLTSQLRYTPYLNPPDNTIKRGPRYIKAKAPRHYIQTIAHHFSCSKLRNITGRIRIDRGSVTATILPFPQFSLNAILDILHWSSRPFQYRGRTTTDKHIPVDWKFNKALAKGIRTKDGHLDVVVACAGIAAYLETAIEPYCTHKTFNLSHLFLGK
ncbi:hypothetical protein ARMSODRAFT_981001 [Armillaria solidipes]|uniref:Uncharacterized protein n=1 Tax=Armillaria solidipes TaxID=1076256 RepID=A0A2H3AWW2_9AGAR|nr:hypothetical protein ARMSODRAFT_981001 [Armillaria solidipes]